MQKEVTDMEADIEVIHQDGIAGRKFDVIDGKKPSYASMVTRIPPSKTREGFGPGLDTDEVRVMGGDCIVDGSNSDKVGIREAVVIFSNTSCCLSHTIKTLFYNFGVDPAIHELDEIPRGHKIKQALSRLGCNPSVRAVFIGGELVGGANQITSLHLNRSLIPMLKQECLRTTYPTKIKSNDHPEEEEENEVEDADAAQEETELL
ncbi:Monothiol glutaredoxin-S5 [Hibiscus syriacus]|uniref:Monothiol glutaredoxin-S5 n=1 Tax=Hibiscus syriacus TaxID=106335 RepID=A0A6A3B4Q5_HIBSY|nr:Monothiol glutaredoxin-S5 [Hibiscus syriacus]